MATAIDSDSFQNLSSSQYAAAHGTRKRLFWIKADIDDEEYFSYLIRLLTVQISSEYNSYQIQEVPPELPHEMVELAETMRDEAYHGIGLARILRELGVDPEPIRRDAMFGSRKKVLGIFLVPMETYVHVACLRWLGERVGGYQSIAVHGCSYVPYAVWSARNYLDEGRTHSYHGRDVLVRFIKQGRRDEVQKIAELYYPHALDMFGGNNTPNELAYLKHGIKTWRNNDLRRIWIETIAADWDMLGLVKPNNMWKGIRHDYYDSE
ncbi:MAG: phenylacetate-CoA oxygenase subunit PaaI [Gammaproteobacteria bacterium]|nr:phenylacetate-CoA oxygenase subunit PaaI [Gammaproteobacteria bacterium]